MVLDGYAAGEGMDGGDLFFSFPSFLLLRGSLLVCASE